MRAAAQKGHMTVVVFGVQDRTPIVMCTLCRCYTEANRVGLSAPCKGFCTEGGSAYRRDRFLSGRHPRRAEFLDGPFEGHAEVSAATADPQWLADALGVAA